MIYTLEIDGVVREVARGSLRLMRLMNFRKTLEAIINSRDGSYIPPEGGEARLIENGITIFLGSIQRASVAGLAGQPLAPLATRIDCVDSNGIADARYLNATIPAGTVKQQLQFIIATWLGAYGVTLDPAQDDGPSIPALAYTYRSNRRCSDGLTDIAKLARGRVWKINDALQLSALEPASLPSPFGLVEGDENIIGDFTVDVTSEGYANRVIIAGNGSEVIGQKDTFAGNGVQTVFVLTLKNVPAVPGDPVPVGGVVWYSDGVNAPVGETMGLASATWIYDPVANTLTDQGDAGPVIVTGYRSFPIASGTSIWEIYNGIPEALATADDLLEQAGPKGVRELLITSDLSDPAALQALADATLAEHIVIPESGHYETESVGLDAGQVQSANLPSRGAVGSFLLTEIETHDEIEAVNEDESPRLRHRVTAVEVLTGSPSASDQPSLTADLYKLWSEDKTNGSPPVVTGEAGLGPAPPDTAVQFNDAGVFGGNAQFIWEKTVKRMTINGAA